MSKIGIEWSSMELKTKIAIITAIIAFCLGWGLTVAGFVIGSGVISDSVLWVLGQSLIYAGSVLGIGMYVGAEVKTMKASIKRFMSSEEPEEDLDA